MFGTGYSLNSSYSVDVEVEKGANIYSAVSSTFKKPFTVPIIAYLTVQNFLITTLVGAFATGMYYNYSISANEQSASHGLETIHNFTKLQQGFAVEEVNDHIHIFLSQPVLTLKSSADLHTTGLINLDNWSLLHPWFYHQIQEFDMVTAIAFVEPSSDSFAISSYKDGESVKYNMQLTSSKANRLCPTSVSVNGFCPITNGNTTTYPMTDVDAIDSSGVTTKIASPMFGSPDPTELGSYAMLEAPKNEVSWFPTIRVTNAEEGLLGLSFVYPVWTADETFLGSFVGEMDFLITHELLHHLKEESTENTVIYIFQRDEVMVGTSQEDPIVKYDPVLKTAAALKVTDMTDPFINFTQNYFRSEFNGSFLSIPVETSMDAEARDPSSGTKYLFQFTALAPATNLEWMVVVGAPESDYTSKVVELQASIYNELQNNNCNVVILIICFQLILMLLVMSILWFRVVRPLRTLVMGMNKAKNFDFTAISEGTFVTSPSGLSEVYQCEKAFFDMTTRFAAAFKQNRIVTKNQPTTLSMAKMKSPDGGSQFKIPNLDFPPSDLRGK